MGVAEGGVATYDDILLDYDSDLYTYDGLIVGIGKGVKILWKSTPEVIFTPASKNTVFKSTSEVIFTPIK